MIDDELYLSDRKSHDDGMKNDYKTCPTCDRIASVEDIVRLDGKRMCRKCLQERMNGKSRR